MSVTATPQPKYYCKAWNIWCEYANGLGWCCFSACKKHLDIVYGTSTGGN